MHNSPLSVLWSVTCYQMQVHDLITRSWAKRALWAAYSRSLPLASYSSVTGNHKPLQGWIMSIKTSSVMPLPIHSIIHKQQIWLEQSKWTAGSCMSDLAVLQGSIIISGSVITARLIQTGNFLHSFSTASTISTHWVRFLLAGAGGVPGEPFLALLKAQDWSLFPKQDRTHHRLEYQKARRDVRKQWVNLSRFFNRAQVLLFRGHRVSSH